MRQLVLIVFAVLFSINLFAQKDDYEYKSIFGDDKHYSGVGGFGFGISYLGGEMAICSGGSGAVILNRKFLFGGYGTGINSDKSITYTDKSDNSITLDNVEIGHGGLWMGYVFGGSNAIHPVVSLQSGFGSVAYYNADYRTVDPIFVVNPKVEIEFNITRYFRIGVGGNYLLTTGVNRYGMNDNDYSGPGGQIAFRFGWF
jgi:hypothetical protein